MTAPPRSGGPLVLRMRVDDDTPDAKLTPFQVQYGLTGVTCHRPGCNQPNRDRYGPAGSPWCAGCRAEMLGGAA